MATEALTEERIRTLALSQRHLPWGIGSRSEDAIQFARAIEAEVQAALASAPAVEANFCAPDSERAAMAKTMTAAQVAKLLRWEAVCVSRMNVWQLDRAAELLEAQPAPQAGAAEPKRQYFYKNNKCESYNSSKSSCTCWHDEGTGPFAEGRSGLTWREKPTERPSQDAERLDWIIRQGDEFRCFVITDAPGDGEYAAWGDGMDAHGKGKTAREAIDAARAAQAQGGAE